MSPRSRDPQRSEPSEEELDWIDRLSVERRRRAREWQQAFGGERRLAPDGGAGEDDSTHRRFEPDLDTSLFDQDDPDPPPRGRRGGESRRAQVDDGFYDQDEEDRGR
jgi:hypothetical protein